jgi:hypothetical protein
MKRQFKPFFLMLGFSILGSLSLSAQETRAIAKVPFEFQMLGRTMPEGAYKIGKVGTSTTFQLTDPNGHALFVNAQVQETADPAKPSLRFACYGKECVLASISLPGGEVRYSLSPHQIESNRTRKLGVLSMVSVGLGNR